MAALGGRSALLTALVALCGVCVQGQQNYKTLNDGSACDRIKDVDECSFAAQFLGLSDTSATNDGQNSGVTYDPPWCYFESNNLKFNYNSATDDASNTGNCTEGDVCLCRDTARPTTAPTAPTGSPTVSPTDIPTANPTLRPTEAPSTAPTENPSSSPTGVPTGTPTLSPTGVPTNSPTLTPTGTPTRSPTTAPTHIPTRSPTATPTGAPTTGTPTSVPTTGTPTSVPTIPDGWTFRTVFPGDITSLNHAEKEDFKAKLAAEVVASSHGLITPQELQVNIFGGSIIATTTLQKTVSMMSIHKTIADLNNRHVAIVVGGKAFQAAQSAQVTLPTPAPTPQPTYSPTHVPTDVARQEALYSSLFPPLDEGDFQLHTSASATLRTRTWSDRSTPPVPAHGEAAGPQCTGHLCSDWNGFDATCSQCTNPLHNCKCPAWKLTLGMCGGAPGCDTRTKEQCEQDADIWCDTAATRSSTVQTIEMREESMLDMLLAPTEPPSVGNCQKMTRGDVSTFSGTFSFLGSQIQVPEGSVAPLEGVLCPDDRAIPTSGGQSPDCVGDAKLCTATGTPARSMDMFDNLMSN